MVIYKWVWLGWGSTWMRTVGVVRVGSTLMRTVGVVRVGSTLMRAKGRGQGWHRQWVWLAGCGKKGLQGRREGTRKKQTQHVGGITLTSSCANSKTLPAVSTAMSTLPSLLSVFKMLAGEEDKACTSNDRDGCSAA